MVEFTRIPNNFIDDLKLNPYEKEQELHLLFAEKRKHSEWFTLDKKDVEYIKGLCDEL